MKFKEDDESFKPIKVINNLVPENSIIVDFFFDDDDFLLVSDIKFYLRVYFISETEDFEDSVEELLYAKPFEGKFIFDN